MNRRAFLALGAASLGIAGGCSSPIQVRPSTLSSSSTKAVPLDVVRKLIVERTDPLSGRSRYIAETASERIVDPILIARRGDLFRATIENQLPQPTTVHFHGLTLAETQDGAGFDPIAPGAAKALDFEIRNRAGLYWLHPHPQGFTAEQVHAGLACILVVTDDEDAALDQALALAPGNRLAVTLADARVENGAVRPYAPSAEECLHGWFGDRMRVNGALDVRLAVAPGWVRLQLVNACNARGLLLAFRENAGDGGALLPFYLLGTDGGLLGRAAALDRVFLHSAERVDIAIDVTGARGISAVSLAFDPRHQAHGGAIAHRHPARDRYPALAVDTICAQPDAVRAGVLPDGSELPLFTLQVDGARGSAAPSLPARLSALADAGALSDAQPSRSLRLDFDPRTGFHIDNTPYRLDEIAFSVKRGAREVWEVRNSPISMPHPMHLHGFGFRVLRRRGTFGPARVLTTESAGRLPTDLGIKDTVVIWPNETVWLAIDFSLPAAAAFQGRQRYMFHCHNLEHEDGMMMRNFAVL